MLSGGFARSAASFCHVLVAILCDDCHLHDGDLPGTFPASVCSHDESDRPYYRTLLTVCDGALLERYRYYTGWAKKRGHRLMITILSNLNRFNFLSFEDSFWNLQLNGYLKSHCTLHMVYTTLPCETLMSTKQSINDKLKGSVVSMFKVWWCC